MSIVQIDRTENRRLTLRQIAVLNFFQEFLRLTMIIHNFPRFPKIRKFESRLKAGLKRGQGLPAGQSRAAEASVPERSAAIFRDFAPHWRPQTVPMLIDRGI